LWESLKVTNTDPFKFKNTLKIDIPDYRNLSMPEKNAFIYVCEFLMKKCIEKHSCEVCINYAESQKKLDDFFTLLFQSI